MPEVEFYMGTEIRCPRCGAISRQRLEEGRKTVYFTSLPLISGYEPAMRRVFCGFCYDYWYIAPELKSE